MKSIRFLIIALIFSFIFSGVAYCEQKDSFGFGSQTVPKPPSARKVRTEDMKTMGLSFPVTIYSSKESFVEISRFYRQKLTGRGWRDLLAEQNLMSGVGSSSFSKMLIFLKDDDMITVQELPASGASTDTYFSASRGKNSFSNADQVRKPLPRDVPIYPNSRELSFYIEFAESGPLGYVTVDSVESVLDFYRVSMPTYSWVLEGDMPIQEKSSSVQDLEAIPNYNQIFPQEAGQSQDFSMKMGSLRFKKDKKRCTISAAEMPGFNSLAAETTISIEYNE